jgi:hypothetical protein
MVPMTTDSSPQDVVSGVVGEICWRAERGHGSFLTFDFGGRLPGPRRDRGEWHLWVYFGDWKLRDEAVVLATHDDDYALIDRAVARFAGKRLQDVAVSSDLLASTFSFETGLQLVVGANSDEVSPDADWWLLFTSDEHVLVVGPGPSWRYQSSNEP